jgi:hypothetical protein
MIGKMDYYSFNKTRQDYHKKKQINNHNKVEEFLI